MKQTFLMFMFLLAIGSFTFGQSASATYSLGDIEADPFYLGGPTQSSTCPGTLTVTIPIGATITGVDVTYDFNAISPNYQAEQRSQLRCVSPGGISETTVASYPNYASGPHTYTRTDLDIANGVTGGGDIEFELHAGFDNLAAFECGVDYHKVDDGTWTVTVYFLDPAAPIPASNPMPADSAIDVSIAAGMLTWDFGAQTESYDVYFGTDNPPATKVVDDVATGGATSGTYNYSTLTGSSFYYWQIVSRNSAKSETPGPVWRFSTECLPVAVPISENFDSYTFPQWGDPGGYHGLTPLCWSVLSECIYSWINMGWYDQQFNSNSSPNVWMASSEDDFNAWAMMITPEMADPINGLQISFFAKTNSGGGAILSVGTMSDPTDETTYDSLTTISITNAYVEYEVPMTSYTGSDSYIVVRYSAADNAAWYQSVYIDDVSIITAPTCPKPKNLTAGNITSSSADLGWFEQGGATTWNIEYDTAGFIPTGTPSFSTTTNPHTLSGLDPNTAYDFYVQSDCGGGDLSVWSVGYTFQTACVAVPVPIPENFDASSNLPDCWGIAQTGNNWWEIATNQTNSAPNAFMFYQSSSTDKLALVSPMPDVTNLSELQINFYAKSSWQDGHDLEIGTMSDPFDINTFTVFETITLTGSSFVEYEVWFNTYVGTDTYIAFSQPSYETYQYTYIDDITIDYLPSCLGPVDLFVDEESLTGAKVHWTESGTATSWEIEVGFPGFTPGIGAYVQQYSHTGGVYEYVMTGLDASSYYDVYIMADCGGGDVSEWSDPAFFHTDFDYFAGLPVVEDFEPGFDVTGNIPTNVTSWTINDTVFNSTTNSAHNAYGVDNENILLIYGKFDLSVYTQASLSFAQIAKTEGGNDECYVEISIDGGMTFTQLPESAYYGVGNYLVPPYGSPEGPCFNEDSYTEWGTGNTTPDNTWWRNETFDLSSYAGNDNVMIRFRLSSNQYSHRAGWYIDDIVIDTYHGTEIGVTPPSIEVTIEQGSSTIENLTISNMDDFPIGYTATVSNYAKAITTVYSENFDIELPVDWTIIDGGDAQGGDSTWVWTDAAVFGNSLDGTNFMKVQRQWPNIDEEELITPVIDATGYATVYLEFDHYFGQGSADYGEVRVFDGSIWHTVYTATGQNIGGWSNPDHQIINITQYANANLQVDFYYSASSWSRWCVDNVSIQGSDIPLDWLTLNGEFSTGGLLAETESDIIDVEFYASAFAPVGTWYVDVEVTSNDPVNPVIIVPCTMNVIQGLRLDLTVFLEGPFDTISLAMKTDLNDGNYLPLNQPYDVDTTGGATYYGNPSPKWLYYGTESVTAIPNTTVVEWVTVQLRDAIDAASATSASIIGTQAAFLLEDGSIVGLDGSSLMTFPGVTISQNLYVVVYHRNHLAVMSANAVTASGGIYSYDFSSGIDQVYGGLLGHRDLGSGVWGMVSGDGDGNGVVQLSDKNIAWTTDLGESGYKGGDFDMNGIGQLSDKNVQWKNGLGAGGQTPAKNLDTGFTSQVPK